MKKFTLSFFVIAVSVVYAFYQNAWDVTYIPTANPKTRPTSLPPIPVKPKGQYTDGTYDGTQADAYYGMVQVEIMVSSGKLTSVKFLQYPNDRSNSVRINNRAMPTLEREAIQTQNANVQIVSGATDTSLAFRQSLQNALNQAKL